MTETLRLSNSERSTWLRCRRKWYLGTYRRLRPREEPLPGTSLSIGNAVHDALAAYYDPEQRADPVLFAEAAAREEVKRRPPFEDDQLKELELVRAMLTGYLEWLEETGADADLVVEGTESKVEVPLVTTEHGSVTLLSKLDAPVFRKSDGARLALEHKTTGSLDKPLALLKLDTQLLTEHLARFLHLQEQGATAAEASNACHGILYNMLRKVKRTASAKPPFYGRETVPHNVNELRNHWRHVVATAREIQAATARLDAGEDHHTVCPPTPQNDCTWSCPFFKVCVLNDDGSRAEDALDALYVEGDPLERYADAVEL